MGDRVKMGKIFVWKLLPSAKFNSAKFVYFTVAKN